MGKGSVNEVLGLYKYSILTRQFQCRQLNLYPWKKIVQIYFHIQRYSKF
jgi:hypothetical protein